MRNQSEASREREQIKRTKREKRETDRERGVVGEEA